MQTLKAPQLLQHLLKWDPTVPRGLFLVTEDPLAKPLLQSRIAQATGRPAACFSGAGALQQALNHLGTPGLFEPPAPALVELPEKWTVKEWENSLQQIKRLTGAPDACWVVFFPMNARTQLKDNPLASWGETFLSWPPNESESFQMVQVLCTYFQQKLTPNQLEQLAQYAGGDMLSIWLHLERMSQTGLDFDAAFAGEPEVSPFHVVESLSYGRHLDIDLRLQQLGQSGQNTSAIFATILPFLKQLLLVWSAQESGKSLKAAFDEFFIPFPQQPRISRAVQTLSKSAVLDFLRRAHSIELNVRTHANASELLSLELMTLCPPPPSEKGRRP